MVESSTSHFFIFARKKVKKIEREKKKKSKIKNQKVLQSGKISIPQRDVLLNTTL